MKRFLLIIVLCFAGCAAPSQLREDEMRQVMHAARQLVIESGVLRPEERAHIEDKPTISYYFLSRPLADYSVRWRVGEEEEVVVRGRGNFLTLENAVVERKKPIQPPETTRGN